jgi:N-acetylglucosaminyldiphosphoundecaprenol N-acetyl-beta-D-mannosaminyltransferase
MPLVWVSRLKGQAIPERVTGNALVAECCQRAAEMGSSVFLLGAAEGVGAAAATALRERFPGLRIAGVYSPPFGPLTRKENDRIIRLINAARPSFLFVALGAPRQDLWIAQNRQHLDVPVAMGVGCVLDLLAGNVRRAPQWMQGVGLEWAYRMLQEPQRLWRRYIMDDIPMLGQLVWDALRQRDERLPVIPAAAGNQPT